MKEVIAHLTYRIERLERALSELQPDINFENLQQEISSELVQRGIYPGTSLIPQTRIDELKRELGE